MKLFTKETLPFYILSSNTRMHNPITPHLRQYWHSPLFILAILTGVHWSHLTVLICISLAVNEVEHLLMCLLTICIFSSVKCYPHVFCPRSHWVVWFFIVEFWGFFIWYWSLGKVFSKPTACLFILLTGYFEEKKVLKIMLKPNLLFLLFYVLCFWWQF